MFTIYMILLGDDDDGYKELYNMTIIYLKLKITLEKK